MAKYKYGNFLQLDRTIFNDEKLGVSLSWQAKWLYVVLSELEHRFTGRNVDYFFRTAKEMEQDVGMAYKTILKYRRELEEAGLLETWKMHWYKDESHTKMSEKYVMAYRLLR